MTLNSNTSTSAHMDSSVENCGKDTYVDNSNPQQGNNRRVSSLPPEKKDNCTVANHGASAVSAGAHKKSRIKHNYKQVKIPPNKKDGRKLFVGGIAGNGECRR
mmetsp:Transcript_44654/g.65681  ORF Transcript_44654/g.65681 Transcript_44654/m.65681 type:complete len:103 (+) Transcript_44654:126-434(+)